MNSMPPIQPSAARPRFSGYRVRKNGEAELFLPGHASVREGASGTPQQGIRKVQAQIIAPGGDVLEKRDMEEKDGYWRTSGSVPAGSLYRFDYTLNGGNHPDRLSAVLKASDGNRQVSVLKTPKGNDWRFPQPDQNAAGAVYEIEMAAHPALTLYKVAPGQPPVQHPLEKTETGFRFSLDDNAPKGTQYRLAPAPDLLETVTHGNQGTFNRVAAHEAQSPQKSTVMADIYPDSVLSPERLAQLDQEMRKARRLPEYSAAEPHVPALPMRDHFNIFTPGNSEGLERLVPELSKAGFSAIVFKPFIGGDNLSSHRYWTTDPYVLNNTFKSKADFRNALRLMLKNGMKVYADGAFVNQGLNGVQMMSNLAHGMRSPYWNWFRNGENAKDPLAVGLPRQAHEKQIFGILPTRVDPKTGQRAIDYEHFAVRILNNPLVQGFDRKKPTFVELYDPRLEDASGKPLSSTATRPTLKGSTDSVQKYRFPVDPEEVKAKSAQTHSASEKAKWLEWSSFRLEAPSHDDSSEKWDGQIDVALMNTKNPEVAGYLKGAIGYWSRMVMNTNTDEVARALAKAKSANPKPKGGPAEWVDAITTGKPERPGVPQVLPAESGLSADRLDGKALRELAANPRLDIAENRIGRTLASRMLDEVPMSVLPLPPLFKANLSYPGFSQALRQKNANGVVSWLDRWILKPLSAVWMLGAPVRALRDWLLPQSFESRLSKKLDSVSQGLDAGTRAKLRNPRIQSIVADKLSERVYLAALTGLPLSQIRNMESDPKQLEEALYAHLPEDVVKQDPVTVAGVLPGLMAKRLAKINTHQLAGMVETEVRQLDPELVELAGAVLNQREMGLNWRIDAAKDVGDIEGIRAADDQDKPALFQKEINFVRDFWTKMGSAMREPFPKTSINAELTDFDALANDSGLAKKAMQDLFSSNTFTSTPNMSYLYSPILELVNYAQRPDEFGAWQTKPSRFFREKVVPMSQSVPFPALKQYQNLTSSHDYATSSHAMLINPELFNMDRLKPWGLKDDFIVATAELETKECFQSQRDELLKRHGIDVRKVLPGLRDWLDERGDSHIKDRFVALGKPELKGFFDEYEKTKDKTQKTTNQIPTPDELKGPFVETLLANIPEKRRKALGLEGKSPEAMKALGEAIKARINEPGEAKAMRGVIVNAALDPNVWAAVRDRKNAQGAPLYPKLGEAQIDRIRQTLWPALDGTAAEWGRHFGYQPLDLALNHVFDRALKTPGWETPLKAVCEDPRRLMEDVKLAMHNQARKPVLEKLKRVFAVQNALPGNPSVYLPDWFAQGGSEWQKNIFAQNRNIIRVDKSAHDSEFRAFQEAASRIFNARRQLEALNDGVVLPVEINDSHGVLPIIRDNGKDQVITLIHTGEPEPLEPHAGKMDFEQPTYPEVKGHWGPKTLSGFRLNAPHLTPGSEYEDVLNPGDRFVLRSDGILAQRHRKPDGSVEDSDTFVIDATRILRRVKTAAPFGA